MHAVWRYAWIFGLSLASAAPVLAAGSVVTLSYTGPSSPGPDEWELRLNGLDWFDAFQNITGTSIPDDMGFPAWEVSDDTALTGVYYSATDPALRR